MRDTLPIKYWIPKLNFSVKPSSNLIFKVLYIKEADYAANTDWVTISDSYEIDVNGNTPSSNKLELTNLLESTDYIIRFTDSLSRYYDFLFKTGKNVSLSDSPYYNKTLFPGQTYDWYINDIESSSNPTTSEVNFYYKLASKKGVTIDTDSWNSIVTLIESGTTLVPTTLDGSFNYAIDSLGYKIMGMSFDNTGDSPGKCIAFPFVKYSNPTTWVNCSAYWFADGGGGVALDDVVQNSMNIGFAFLVKDTVTTDQILCGCDTTKTSATASLAKPLKYSITFTSDCHLKTTLTENGTTNTVTDTNVLLKNKWYYCILGTSISLYTMEAKNETNTLTFTSVACTTLKPSITTYTTNIPSSTKLPFYFGSPSTNGVVIGKIIGGVITTDPSTLINKLLNTYAFVPSLKLSGTTISNKTWEYTLPSKCLGVVLTNKVSFIIDPDIFTNVSNLTGVNFTDTGAVTAQLIIDNAVKDTHIFNGFSYVNTSSGNTINVGGIIDNPTYRESSYDIIFALETDPINSLAEHFFTKHGIWGGYNGGVNGHNIYFNGEGNLVLECHGDLYTGTLKGVGKELDLSTYTGYGGDIAYSNNTFDHRVNNNCIRTGTALVSNKYVTYGRIDVMLKIPVNTWGLCPAIWLFHYIEVSDLDFRYNTAPYNGRNILGSAADGFYRVVNNEIDIELPSHLANGTATSWNELATSYFDLGNIDNQMHIGITADSNLDDIGLFLLNTPTTPTSKSSWTKVSSNVNPRYIPSFLNCKFNNWLGELNAGNGWCKPAMYETTPISAEDYYKGTGPLLTNFKEEYLSLLTHLVDNTNGFADGSFHKWSIIWLPDRTVLLIDDVVIRENTGFVPFNLMKFTIAGWFPTMALDNRTDPTGVKDSDGIHGTPGAILTNLDGSTTSSVGTWAGTLANFNVLHLEVSEIKYTKYLVGDNITVNGTTTHIAEEPYALGESFPESGLRMFVK